MAAQNGDFKSQVLAATDIVELIGQAVPLKKMGTKYKGLCPFHNEKTPSFTVDQTKQYFYCFGCKEHGNAIDFVMKRDRVEFVDAMKLLGQRAGLEMPKFGVSKEKTSERQVLMEAQSAAASYFQKNLAHPEIGRAAREYLAKRGFNKEVVTAFQVGVAINGWDGLVMSAGMKKYPPAMLHLGGLVKQRDKGGGYYDTFRNRLMFPIRDENGRVIAFGGRVMPGSEDPAKYLNSPETPLFSKSRCVFGLDLAKKRIVESRTVVIVEGYTDVMMAHQFDVSNVVSVLGTALTEQHVGLLKRFADRIVFLFDPDAAGDMAAERAVEVALGGAFSDVRIATLPEGVDPDEFLLKYGKEEFEKVLEGAPDAFAFRWTQMARKHSVNGVMDQDAAVREFVRPFDRARLAGTVDQIRWGFILTRLSRLMEMSPERLNRVFDIRKTAEAGQKKDTVGQAGTGAATREAAPAPQKVFRRAPLSQQVSAERWLLGCLLVEPGRWTEVQRDIHVGDFTDERLRVLAEIYWGHQRDEGEPEFNQFVGTIQDAEIAELAIELMELAQTFPDVGKMVKEAVGRMRIEKERAKEAKLLGTLRRTGVVETLPENVEVDLIKQLFDKKREEGKRGA